MYIKGELVGELEFTSNGDGTCSVSGLKKNYNTNLAIPSVSPDGDTVTAIGSQAFYSNGDAKDAYVFSTVEIPDTVASIGSSAFRFTLFKNITIPDSVTDIQHLAFADNPALKSITIPDSVTSLGSDVFAGCTSLKTATISNNVTELKGQLFYGCTSLTSVTLGNSISTLGNSVISSCPLITRITLPVSLKKTYSYAINDCSNLSIIKYAGTKEQWKAIDFGPGWIRSCPAQTITCSDGELSLFRVGNEVYYAEEGMTWGDWISSDYNTDGYVINSGEDCVRNAEGYGLIYDGATVVDWQEIIPGATYTRSNNKL
jgi:hypothetical protein